MSLLNERQKMRPIFMPVICPRCDAPMKIKKATPVIATPSLDEVVYSCPGCHDESKRTVLKHN